MSQTIVIDLYSVVANLDKAGRKMTGIPAAGLVDYVRLTQARGSTVFFIAGQAHEPDARQKIENFLESIGIRSVFVTHGLPDHFDLFICSKAFVFDGERFPVP